MPRYSPLLLCSLVLAACSTVPEPAPTVAPGPSAATDAEMEALLQRADSLYAAGRFDRAIPLYAHAVDLHPGDLRTYEPLAYSYAKLGLFEEAEQWLWKRRRRSMEPALDHCYLADVALRQGDRAAIALHTDSLIAFMGEDPARSEAFCAAQMLSIQGDDEGARRLAEAEVTKLRREGAPLVGLAGLAFYTQKTGEVDRTEALLREYEPIQHENLRKGEDLAGIHFTLAEINALRGNPDAVVSHLREALHSGGWGEYWGGYYYLRADPIFQSLHGHPEFERLMAEIEADIERMRARVVASMPPEERVDALMAEYDRTDSPGAVVGVIEDGEVVFAKGYGMANLAHGVPITPEMRFNIGSVSKQFTGFALALLESRGQLSLDDPVCKYLPEVPEFEHEVTLRHLLTHTSGYRQAYDISFLAGRMPVESEDMFRRAEALEVVRRQPKLEFPPGSKYQYNSTAYVLLAEIVERVTGEPFPEWMQEHVFAPLGMEHAVVESEIGQVIPGAADSYVDAERGGYRTAFGNRAVYGAGEIYTTLGDLAGWLRNFHTADLGGPAVQERMRERFVLSSGDTIDYALGLRVDEHRGLQRIHHGGSQAGYLAYLSYYAELDAGIVVMSNYGDFARQHTVDEMADIFFGQYMAPEKVKRVTEENAPFPHSGTWSPTAMELSAYTGRYFSPEAGTVYTFTPGNGQLVGDHRWSSGRITRGEGDLLFAPLGKDAFVGENSPLQIRFKRAEDGSVTGYYASLIGGASGVWFAKVESPQGAVSPVHR